VSGKRFLVTGGCGFVGSNLVDFLIEKGYDVDVVDDLSSGTKDNMNNKAQYYFENVINICNFFPTSLGHYDCIFHLDAEARIQPSYQKPDLWMSSNVQGTTAVCEYARKIGAKVVFSGSSSCYSGKYMNPYTFSKKVSEEVCEMYSRIYGLDVAIARFFNVYGPRNPLIGEYTPVIAKFEQQYRNGLPLTIVGDGTQKRDFTHVYDICNGLYKISQGEWSCEIFNLGTGKNYTINEIARMFSDLVEYIPKRPGEAKETLADTEFTRNKLGWKTKINLSEYIKEQK